ncbi:MAG: subunit of TIM23 translocase complex [Peltula sp. TS41687]|nr:MAG: subunit of TIM23 translocase complex [Peltula sp. TS41687]
MPVPARAEGAGGGRHGPSTWDKLKMGGMIGGSVGLIIGFLFGIYATITSPVVCLYDKRLTEGLVVIVIIGGVNIIRHGPGSNGLLRTLGQYMLGSAATFGFVPRSSLRLQPNHIKQELTIWGLGGTRFFMSIGSAIRTDSSPIAMEAFARAQGRPIVMPRKHSRLRERPSS